MRGSVLKQRADGNRSFVRKGDFPDEFQEVWNKRKNSDHKSRKDAGYAVYLIMKSELTALRDQCQTQSAEISRLKAQMKIANEALRYMEQRFQGTHPDPRHCYIRSTAASSVVFNAIKDIADLERGEE